MKHPHIVGLLDYKQTTSYFHLVMDYCSMGDLSYFIRRRNNLVKSHPVISSLLHRYPSPEGSHGLMKFWFSIFETALVCTSILRDKSLVHRDIKPQNSCARQFIQSRNSLMASLLVCGIANIENS